VKRKGEEGRKELRMTCRSRAPFTSVKMFTEDRYTQMSELSAVPT
jgi:hypothetical protein